MPPALILAAVASLASPASPATAAAPTRLRFDIPAQPLSTAIEAYAEASGVEVLYDRQAGPEPLSAEVHGLWSAPAALDLLLKDTGLSARFSDPRNAVLTGGRASTEALPPPTALDLPRLSLGVLRVEGAVTIGGRAPLGPVIDRFYAEAFRARVQTALDGDATVAKGDYQSELDLQIAPDGHVAAARLLASSGDAARDAAILAAARRTVMDTPPPRDFPRRIRLRVRSRRGA